MEFFIFFPRTFPICFEKLILISFYTQKTMFFFTQNKLENRSNNQTCNNLNVSVARYKTYRL